MAATNIILTLVAAQVVISMTPGPSAVFVLQSALHGKKFGFIAVVSICLAGFLMATVGLAGVAAFLLAFPQFG